MCVHDVILPRGAVKKIQKIRHNGWDMILPGVEEGPVIVSALSDLLARRDAGRRLAMS